MGLFENILEKLASLQKRHSILIIVLFLIITLFLGYGIKNIELESDFSKLMPQDLPIMKLNDRIKDKFSGQDTIFILIMLDNSLESKGTPTDIRDPRIMNYLVDMQDSLKHELTIDSVISVAPYIEQIPNRDLGTIKTVLDSVPASSSFISDDKSKTIMIITADVGGSEEKVNSLNELIQNKINALSTPLGTKVILTGTPQIRAKIIELLKHDSIYTLVIASLIIILLLIIMQRSFTQSIVIYTPILLGIIWTMGTMGWLGIKLSIVTAGLGAMILGLGVEYGVFIITRYKEERENLSQEDALKQAVPGVGSAIIGSGTTTIIGFLALSLSIMPLLQQLGQSLALGIFFSIIAAVAVEPAIIIVQENYEYWSVKKKKREMIEKRKLHKIKKR